MLRLNMAVPATPRNSPDFSNQGLLAAAVLGLTDPRFNGTHSLQFIPNMDGFPNGRRLEDEVVKIELQAVSGAALAAIGLWYDDYTPGTTASPVTPQLQGVLNFTAGVEQNDTTFRATFPYVQTPWQGSAFVANSFPHLAIVLSKMTTKLYYVPTSRCPLLAAAVVGVSTWSQLRYTPLEASSHREAPLIADDPLADNTDLYAFRDPDDAEQSHHHRQLHSV